MITHSIIQKSQIERGHRLDAEYYQPEYLKLSKKIYGLELPKLQDLSINVDASAFYPSIAEWYSKEGVPFIRVGDVVNFQVAEEDLLFLPSYIVDKFKSIRKGKPGDIIITKGGTVGNVALLQDKYQVYALSRDIIVLKTSKLLVGP